MLLVLYPEIAGLQPLLLASSTTLTWSAWSPRPVPARTPESEHKSRLIPDPAFCRHYIVLDQCYCFRLKLSLLQTSCSTLFSLWLTPTIFLSFIHVSSLRDVALPQLTALSPSSGSVWPLRACTPHRLQPPVPIEMLLGAWAQEERLWQHPPPGLSQCSHSTEIVEFNRGYWWSNAT